MKIKFFLVVLSFHAFGQENISPSSYPKASKQEKASVQKLSIEQLREAQSALSAKKFLKVKFEQEHFRSFRKRSIYSRGEALFAKPEKFRWTLFSPLDEEYIFDGKNLYHHQILTKRAVKFSTDKSQARDVMEIISMVLDIESLLKKYEFVAATRDDDEVFIELKAKNDKEMDKVDVLFSVKNAYISYVKLYFKNQNFLAINFNSPIFGEISTNAFDLPKTVKITDSHL